MSAASAPTIIAGRYQVIGELGRGGMGVVYRARHVHTGAVVALKVMLGQAALSQQHVERFRRESKISARVASDNIVRILDADTAPELENAPYLVMELLDGENFEQLVTRTGPLPAPRALQLLREVAHGLGRAHDAGIVHRDLKPENLFVHRTDRAEVVKILDFGISKILGNSGSASMADAALTSTGAILGTPLYMAPEQARGLDVGRSTDVWAFGLIATYLLTGDVYWKAESMAALLTQILIDPMPPPSRRWPALPYALDSWFAQCVARTPAERFSSIGEAFAVLEHALGEGRSAGPYVPGSPSSTVALGPGSWTPANATPANATPPGLTPGVAPAAVGVTPFLSPSQIGQSASGGAVAVGPRSTRAGRLRWLPLVAALAVVVAVGGGYGLRVALQSRPNPSDGSAAVSGLVAQPPASQPTVEPASSVAVTPPPSTANAIPTSSAVVASASASAVASAPPLGHAPRIAPAPATASAPATHRTPPAATRAAPESI